MTRSLLEDQRDRLGCCCRSAFFCLLIGNLPWQLDDYDQAKQAFTSFEMIKEGHWFYQQTPHERVATKPPLVGWISAGLFGMTRSWEVAWRLPSLLAAIALAILLFRIASSAYGSIAGLVAFRCLWTKSAESAPGDTRAHGHATGICDLSYWPPDLAENPEAARMDAAQIEFTFSHY